jgi:hypothetical protein
VLRSSQGHGGHGTLLRSGRIQQALVMSDWDFEEPVTASEYYVMTKATQGQDQGCKVKVINLKVIGYPRMELQGLSMNLSSVFFNHIDVVKLH